MGRQAGRQAGRISGISTGRVATDATGRDCEDSVCDVTETRLLLIIKGLHRFEKFETSQVQIAGPAVE